MENLGNSCYINSTLQALFHIPAIAHSLMDGSHEGSKCTYPCIECILVKTIQECSISSVIKPIEIYRALNFIGNNFVKGRMEDSHEFLLKLLDCVTEQSLAKYTLGASRRKESIVQNLFGGTLNQNTVCLKCGNVSSVLQFFLDLQLDIFDDLENSLSDYFKNETLCDGNEHVYKCEKCKVKVPAVKKFEIKEPPKVLCIQLKRFDPMQGKNNTPVRYPEEISLSKYVSSNATSVYKLVSLISHYGGSCNSGHYTCVGKVSCKEFFIFDDMYARPVSNQEVLHQDSAYILFYEIVRGETEVLSLTGTSSPQPSISMPTIGGGKGKIGEQEGEMRTSCEVKMNTIFHTHSNERTTAKAALGANCAGIYILKCRSK